jgi:glycine/D-amino acid oxidase-like deaminating enzyme
MLSRRDVLKATVATASSAFLTRSRSGQSPRVAVIGAGAFGGWTALELVRRGARVVLIDAWGPGNARASSGGETRVIRTGYGTRTIYTKMAKRALELWGAHDQRYGRGFFKKTGALWMFGKDDAFRKASTRCSRTSSARTSRQPVRTCFISARRRATSASGTMRFRCGWIMPSG